MCFREPTSWPAHYDDCYRHFDNLIWQVPAWGTAVFAGILAALATIHEKAPLAEAGAWGVSRETLTWITLFSGIMFLATSYYTLLRWRTHQVYTQKKNAPRPLGPFGAQLFLQLTLGAEAAFLMWLLLQRYLLDSVPTWIVAGLTVTTTVATEFYINMRKRHAKNLPREPGKAA
jgi:putative Ca2+/H+ antiporter (TMEM165/GDT1 family)